MNDRAFPPRPGSAGVRQPCRTKSTDTTRLPSDRSCRLRHCLTTRGSRSVSLKMRRAALAQLERRGRTTKACDVQIEVHYAVILGRLRSGWSRLVRHGIDV